MIVEDHISFLSCCGEEIESEANLGPIKTELLKIFPVLVDMETG